MSNYFFPEWVQSIVMSHVCLSVCLSVSLFARIARKPQGRTSIFSMPKAVPLFSCGGTAICYVLPVLWMTFMFSHNGHMARHAYSYINGKQNSRDSHQILNKR